MPRRGLREYLAVIGRLWRHGALLAVLQMATASVASAAELSIHEVAPAPPEAVGERRPDQLPGSRITRGGRNITAAWLAGPTDRYDTSPKVTGTAIRFSARTTGL